MAGRGPRSARSTWLNWSRDAPPMSVAGPGRPARREASREGGGDHGAGDGFGERCLRDVGREVDAYRLVKRAVDAAAVEEGIDQVAACLWLFRPEGGRVAEPGEHELVAV